jgi:hypothetical protein
MLDTLTTELGDGIRVFVDKTCSKFDTKELSREYQARKRREARQRAKQGKQNQAKNQSAEPTAKGDETVEKTSGIGVPSSNGQGSQPAKRRKTGNGTSTELSTDAGAYLFWNLPIMLTSPSTQVKIRTLRNVGGRH